jgi:hypothetical protein
MRIAAMTQATDLQFLPADRFVDPKNRKYPVQSQQDVDRAARALPALDSGATFSEDAKIRESRKCLAMLARRGGWLLPTTFFVEEVETLNAADDRYATFRDAGSALNRDRADLMALTPAGVSVLKDRGLKPSEPKIPGDSSGVATFSSSTGTFVDDQDDIDRGLAASEMGRAALNRRGVSASRIHDLQQGNHTIGY